MFYAGSPRFALCVLVFMCITCHPSGDVKPTMPPNHSCGSTGNGVSEKHTPLVCVDDSAQVLKANPDPITAWDRYPKEHPQPMMIHWVTRSGGGNLGIRMEKEGCVERPECNGKGRCHAKVIAGDETRQCKYTITLDGHPDLDPDAIIVKCCSN